MAKTAVRSHSSPDKKRFGGPIWDGSISFGLVNIPVRLYPGVRKKEMSVHMLHKKDNARIVEKFFCSEEEKEVPRDEIEKGYEVGRNQHVVLDPSELEAFIPKASHTIELFNFVDKSEIDPAYFDRPYYLVPGENAAKPYRLLSEAMKEAERSAVARFVMRNKEYVALVRPIGSVLCLDTMRFPDEIILPEHFANAIPSASVSEREKRMARQLIESLTGQFEPKTIHDEYRQKVMDLVHRKAEGQQIAITPESKEDEGPEVIDLMSALEKSLHYVKRQKLKHTA